MSHDVQLGKILEGPQQRDAIHVAIAPVVATDRFHAGQHVGLREGTTDQAVGACVNPIGIVDPFLTKLVMPGEKFYLFLYPQTVTGMRHHWEHPAFAEIAQSDKSVAEAWLRDAAERSNMSYQQLMDACADFLEHGEYTHMGDNEEYDCLYGDDALLLWQHYATVAGVKVPDDTRTVPFSCAC